MDSTGSILKTFIKRVRLAVDEPTDDAMYSDTDLVNHFFIPCAADLISRINMQSQGRICLRTTITLTDGQEYYALPPSVARVLRVCALDDFGFITYDIKPRGEFHSLGPGWSVQGNTIGFRPFPTETGDTVQLWYVSSGSYQSHYATDGGLYSGDTTYKTFTLSASPALGNLDKRLNGYGGQLLRILSTTTQQEVPIESYDPATRRAVLRLPLDASTPTSNVTYEVVPFCTESLCEAAAMRGAVKMLAFKQASSVQRQALSQEYQSAMKSVLDDISNVNGRTGSAFQKSTQDSADLIWAWNG